MARIDCKSSAARRNVRAGLKVAVAMVGAQLPNDVVIKRAMLRGQESNGMLCSARELGLGDEHDGIMELPARCRSIRTCARRWISTTACSR